MPLMGFKVGETVLVEAIRKQGEIYKVEDNGIYAVAIGSLTVRCKEHELRRITLDKAKSSKEKKTKKSWGHSFLTEDGSAGNSKAATTIDLHGLTVAQAIPLVETFLDRAIVADLDKVEIIHGIGSGAIKRAVHDLLKNNPVVKNFAPHMLNPGITVVYL